MNRNEIIDAICNIDNFEDMRPIIDAINVQQKRIARMNTRKFSIGDYVYFIDRGDRYDGRVIKVNQRTVKVRVGMFIYTVDALLLNKELINTEVA